MFCPRCGASDTRVIDSRVREAPNAVKRRRECRSCGHRFTTFERCEDPLEVIKTNGTTEVFDRNKLLVGLMRATSKRDIELNSLNVLIDEIEAEIRATKHGVVTSHEIGDMVLKRLENIDKVAYIRFASVYRDFKDIDEFLSELDKLR
ncbi:transcriptional regulator NrdR [Collinsella sp. AGMB00827]|uniref:Transcriptional repressor NrdR n=1 Tax=Collinsella ureilytica TaxID=2869515 RepID=A0ABS7MKV9_9ACTN|nr:transcriptional regulator NrdR [Collinsella urealyticum]MBY4797999.1 transcriptional regulator NrdR [Collinsella urealyticum]